MWFTLAVTVLGVSLFLATSPYMLRGMGRFLVIAQEPGPTDVIIVLNGRDTERSLAAVDLFERGYADRIVIAKGVSQPGSDEFWRRVGEQFDGKTFFQRSVEAMGVPAHAFQLIGNGVASTYDEAKVAERFMRENDYRRLLLVTSKWHSRRAYWIFETVFRHDEKIEIRICPSEYDTFDPETWWKNEVEREVVFGEYARFLYYMLKLRTFPFKKS